MLKKLGLSACVLVLGGGLALAEEHYNKADRAGRSVATAPSSLSSQNWLASDIYKADIYDKSERKIGGVADLVMDSKGNIKSVIVGVGGFLGVGEKDVAISFSDLKVASRDGKDWLVLDRTKEQLKQAPAYDLKRNEMK